MQQSKEAHISEQEAKEKLEKQTGIEFAYSYAKYNDGLKEWSFAVQNENGKIVFHAASSEDFAPYLALAHHLRQPFSEMIDHYVWIYGEECEFGLGHSDPRYCLTNKGWLAVSDIESAFLERFGKYRKNYSLQDEQWLVTIDKNECSSSTYRKNKKPGFPPLAEKAALAFKDFDDTMFLLLPAEQELIAAVHPHATDLEAGTSTETDGSEAVPAESDTEAQTDDISEQYCEKTEESDPLFEQKIHSAETETIADGISDISDEASTQPEEDTTPKAAESPQFGFVPFNEVEDSDEQDMQNDAEPEDVSAVETSDNSQFGFVPFSEVEENDDNDEPTEPEPAQEAEQNAKIQAFTQQIAYTKELNNDARMKIGRLECELTSVKKRYRTITGLVILAFFVLPFIYRPITAFIGNMITPTYKVTFLPNTATSGLPPPPLTAKAGTDVDIPDAQDLFKDGFLFGGWNTEPDGSGEDYEAGSTHVFTEDVTLYAQWGVEKFVHIDALNVRESPSSQSKLLFLLKQNEKIFIISNDKMKPWVKIKHSGKTGYVNGTYLRDFKITKVLIGNAASGNRWLTEPSSNPQLWAEDIRFLMTQIEIETLAAESVQTDFKIKIIDPYGTVERSNKSPAGYSYTWSINIADNGIYSLAGWGIAYASSYERGKWRVEIWYANSANPSNTNAMIASRSFNLK